MSEIATRPDGSEVAIVARGEIYAVSTGSGGRKFRFEAQGANEAVSWTSAKAYDPNMKHDIEFGLALNANNTAYLLLWDATGHTEIAKLSDSFVFSMAPGSLLMLGNPVYVNWPR